MSASVEAFDQVIKRHTRQALIDGFIWLKKNHYGDTSPELQAQAEEFADRVIAEGKEMEVLEAMTPKPCPECGRS